MGPVLVKIRGDPLSAIFHNFYRPGHQGPSITSVESAYRARKEKAILYDKSSSSFCVALEAKANVQSHDLPVSQRVVLRVYARLCSGVTRVFIRHYVMCGVRWEV